MFPLKLLSAAAGALAGVLLVMSFGLEAWQLLPSGAAAVVCSVLFYAGSQIIELLSQIRDRLPVPPEVAKSPVDAASDPAPRRSLSELEADLARLKAKNAPAH